MIFKSKINSIVDEILSFNICLCHLLISMKVANVKERERNNIGEKFGGEKQLKKEKFVDEI